MVEKIKEKDWEKFCEDNEVTDTRVIIRAGAPPEVECMDGTTKKKFIIEG